MNKTELINAMAEKSGMSKSNSKKALEAMIDTISSELKKGEHISLLGFGTFSTVKREKRNGINPQTKKPITIPARTAVRFKAGSLLTEKVNK